MTYLPTPLRSASDWDGFAANWDETDGGKVLGIADLIPDEARHRRGTWRHHGCRPDPSRWGVVRLLLIPA